jgi:hypothetical protein
MKGELSIMRLNRTALAVVGSALLVGGMSATALAAGGISPNVADSTTASTTLTVNWSGIVIPAGQNQIVVIQQCWKNDSGPFNQADDCSQSSATNPAVGAGGSGSAQFTVFNGDEVVNQLWGCGPLTSAGTPSASTCYVRIAPGINTNTASDEFFPFTYAPPSSVPEVPLNILLPGSAAAVLGGALLIARRRHIKLA